VDEAMAEMPIIAIPVIASLAAAGAGMFFLSQAIRWNGKLLEKKPAKAKRPHYRTALPKLIESE
jgi:hypothetical protein